MAKTGEPRIVNITEKFPHISPLGFKATVNVERVGYDETTGPGKRVELYKTTG